MRPRERSLGAADSDESEIVNLVNYGIELNKQLKAASDRLRKAVEAVKNQAERDQGEEVPDDWLIGGFRACNNIVWPRTSYFSVDDGMVTSIPLFPVKSGKDPADRKQWLQVDIDRLKRLVDKDMAEAMKDRIDVKLEGLDVDSDDDRKEITDLLMAIDDIDKCLKSGDMSELCGAFVSNEDQYRPLDWLKISNIGFSGKFSPEDCERMWRWLHGPDVNRAVWTKSEKAALVLGVKTYGTGEPAWERITEEVSLFRKPLQCACYFHRHLDRRLKVEGLLMDEEKFFRTVVRCTTRRIVDWERVQRAYPSVPLLTLKSKYYSIMDSLVYKKKRLNYVRKESLAVFGGFLLFGRNVEAISDLMGSRSAKSIANHFHVLTAQKWKEEADRKKATYLVTGLLEQVAVELEVGKKFARIGMKHDRRPVMGLTKRRLFEAFCNVNGLYRPGANKLRLYLKYAPRKSKKRVRPPKYLFARPPFEGIATDVKWKDESHLRGPVDARDVGEYLVRTLRHSSGFSLGKDVSVLPDDYVEDFVNTLGMVLDWLDIPALISAEKVASFPRLPSTAICLSSVERSRWEVSVEKFPSFEKPFSVIADLDRGWTVMPAKVPSVSIYETDAVFQEALGKISAAVLRAEVEKSGSMSVVILRSGSSEVANMPPNLSTMVAYQILDEQRAFRVVSKPLRMRKFLMDLEVELVPPQIIRPPPQPAPVLERPTGLRTYSRKRNAPGASNAQPTQPTTNGVSSVRKAATSQSGVMSPIDAAMWLQNTIKTLFTWPHLMSAMNIPGIFDPSSNFERLWDDDEAPKRAYKRRKPNPPDPSSIFDDSVALDCSEGVETQRSLEQDAVEGFGWSFCVGDALS